MPNKITREIRRCKECGGCCSSIKSNPVNGKITKQACAHCNGKGYNIIIKEDKKEEHTNEHL